MLTLIRRIRLRSRRDTIGEAYRFALAAHEGQTHRDGKPAIAHAERVARRFLHDPELYAIAILHDVLEDCPDVEFGDIVRNFGIAVALGVQAMTREEGESWNHYIAKVKAHRSATLVKIADIEDNIGRADAKFAAKMDMYVDALFDLHVLAVERSGTLD